MSTNTTTLAPTPDRAAAESAGGCAEMANLPPPQAEHVWLQRFVGEWATEVEMLGASDQPPVIMKGTDRARMVGGYWLVAAGHSDAFPYECRLTLGYDPQRQRYVGTWVDSMSSFLWHYEGTVDASGQVLTLETEGPFPPAPGSPMTRFREVTEFKSDDHRVFTSSKQEPDGRWSACVRINFRRKRG